MKKIPYITDFEQWKQEFEFFVPIKIRFCETDMFGHVNNTVPFIYFETARIEFLENTGFMSEWSKPESETIPVVADLQCDYLKQIYYGDELKVYVKINRVGNSSIDIHYMGVTNGDSICITGRGTLVNVNKKTGKGQMWTPEERQLLLAGFKETSV